MPRRRATRRIPAERIPVLVNCRFMPDMPSPPLPVLERPAGQEQEKERRRDVIDEPSGVDDPLAEFVHVAAQIQVREGVLPRLAVRELLELADEEEDDQDREGDD